MGKYRNNLPQLNNSIFLTDGGLETTLIFHEGIDLPGFAAFTLLETAEGRDTLKKYYQNYINIAKKNNAGFILESCTWRANRDWANEINFPTTKLDDINKEAINLLLELRSENETPKSLMPISGCLGPRGDGYSIDKKMTADEAEEYHQEQIKSLIDSNVDLVSAFTMSYCEEAIGIVQ
jgi:S-methylmethionine-dependent homocysteine/selenocysteine methylase